MAKNYYKILELEHGASKEEIKKSYHRLARKWHPDKNKGNEAEAKKRFQDISEAFQVLTNDGLKRQYDTGSDFTGFNFSSDHFKTADELFKEFFGDKTIDEALDDFLNDPMFADLNQSYAQQRQQQQQLRQQQQQLRQQQQQPRPSHYSDSARLEEGGYSYYGSDNTLSRGQRDGSGRRTQARTPNNCLTRRNVIYAIIFFFIVILIIIIIIITTTN